MHKRIYSWVLAVIMVFSMFGGINLEAFGVPGVPECKIGETEYELFADALTASVDGDTIVLLRHIDHTGKIAITNKTITFDLNGLTLNATNTGDVTVEVGAGGEIGLTGEGEFNAIGVDVKGTNFVTKGAVYTHDGGKATVTNILLTGDQSYKSHGAYAVTGGIINVLGNSTADTPNGTHCRGAQTEGINSKITVYGKATSANSQGVVADYDSEIEVFGDVESRYTAALATFNSKITVHGNTTSIVDGAKAFGGSHIFIGGDAISSSANYGYGAHAHGTGSLVNVSGSAISYGDYSNGVFSSSGGSVTVHGDVNSSGTGGKGVYTTFNGTAIINGNVISENGTGVWAWHNVDDKPSVTIDGEIIAETFIQLDRNADIKTYRKDDYVTPTTKAGYYTYTDGHSVVWVSYPKVWGIEIESTDQYPFDGGDGSSEETAYEISTANHLAQLAYNVNTGNLYSGKYFKLVNDVDLSGKEWVPIGAYVTNYFNGSFDGNNRIIVGLKIGSSTVINTSYYASGLFGVIGSDSALENLRIFDSTIYSTTTMGTGTLAGYNNGGEINHCGSAGTINSYPSPGGLVGRNAGNIYNSYSNVNVTSNGSDIGGFVAYNDGGNIVNSYATGDVIAGAYPHAGGFVGYAVNWSGSSVIENCYATGDVSGSAWGYIGGFYGRTIEGINFVKSYWNQDADIIAVEHNGYTPSVHGSSENCLSIPSATMKSDSFVSQLNSNLPSPQTDYYEWKIQAKTNEGYPVHGNIFTSAPEEPSPSPRPSIPELGIETTSLPDGIEGEEYEFEMKAVGGVVPYNWSAEGLPVGLSMSAEGIISGISDESGNFSVKVEMMDNRNYYRSRVYDLSIEKIETENIFEDAKDHWSGDYIKEVVSRNIINGYPDRTFRPENKITREEFASILVRALGLESKTGLYFEDTLDRWSTGNISTAVYHSIIKGYSENAFGPEDFITREQMAVMIARALVLDEASEDTSLSDMDEASTWSKSAILSAVSRGLLDGYPDGTFKPKNNLTRAEAIKVIFNLLINLDGTN